MRLTLILCAMTAGLFAADCDVVFSLVNAGDTVQFNNKGKACANFQVSYFSAGFSAVNLQFESAPDAGTTPGTWVAFAGTTLSGSNPMTSTTQSTSTFSGVYPWLRVRLVSKTGTGTITGRLLGIQLTTAGIGFENSFTVNLFGRFTPPDNASFTSVDLGTGIYTPTATSTQLYSPLGTGVRAKRCVPIAAPFTLTAAFRQFPSAENPGGNNQTVSVGFVQTSTGEEEFLLATPHNNGAAASPVQFTIDYTTDNAWGGEAQRSGNSTIINCPVIWARIIDNGVTRNYRLSCDGTNFQDYTTGGAAWWDVSGAPYAAITPNLACFHAASSNGNYRMGGELLSWTIQ